MHYWGLSICNMEKLPHGSWKGSRASWPAAPAYTDLLNSVLIQKPRTRLHNMCSTKPLAQCAWSERKIRGASKKEAALQVTGQPGCRHFPPVLLPWAKHTVFWLCAAQLVSRYSRIRRNRFAEAVSFLGSYFCSTRTLFWSVTLDLKNVYSKKLFPLC